MQHAGRFFSSKTSSPTHTWIFFLAMLFSNHQDRDEGWFNLFFPQLLQLFSLLYFVSSEHPVFLQYHSLLGQFIFLKISKSFQFLICFGFYCSFLRSSKAFHILQKPHLLATRDSQPFISPEDLLTGQSSRLAAPCSGFCLLWHPTGKSWLSSLCKSLFNCMLLSYNLCSILFNQRQELNLTHHWRHATKCPLKIPSALWQCFKGEGSCVQGNVVSNQGHPLDLCEDPRNPNPWLSFL